MTRFIRWTLAITFLAAMAAPAFSQSRNTGEIRGTVTAAGAVVQGATVTLSNIDTGVTKTFVTILFQRPPETTPSPSPPRASRES